MLDADSALIEQYIVHTHLFQLDSAGSSNSAFLSRICLSLWGDDPRFAGCFQFEGVVRKFLVHLDVRIFCQAVITARFEKLLLHRNTAGWVDPKQDPRDV